MEGVACRFSALVCPRPGTLLFDPSRGCGWKTLLPDGTSVTNEFYQAVRLARELAASSSSRREPRRGTEGGPRIARMGRRRVSHKEHKDRKEEGEPALVWPGALTAQGAERTFADSVSRPPSFCRHHFADAPRPLPGPERRPPSAPRLTPPAGQAGPATPPPAPLSTRFALALPFPMRSALRHSPPFPWLQKNPTVRFPPRPPVLSSPHVRSIRIRSEPFVAASRRFAGPGFDGLSSHRPAPAPPSASLQPRLSFPTARGAGLPACRFLGPPAPGEPDGFTPNSRIQGLSSALLRSCPRPSPPPGSPPPSKENQGKPNPRPSLAPGEGRPFTPPVPLGRGTRG